jgi:endonuclease/exonuclease/phosphatase family metal-dependent hydrolase
VDVLALQEFTAADQAGLDAAGVSGVLPYRATYPQPGVVGSAVYSRYPLRDADVRVLTWGFTQARATIEVPGAAPVEFESVHPTAPYKREAVPRWAADLAAQPPATVDGVVRILAGDFNATLDHHELRRLIGRGYHDAAEQAGNGLRMTWSDDSWAPRLVAIDHVLADRRMGVASTEIVAIPGSDHRGVFAELVLPDADRGGG